ncbi:MAG: LysE family translocator [Candidatus Eisenbacteria bacterium]|nr:LysE family translocator [Candidatus Eisenbacteria bacterium]
MSEIPIRPEFLLASLAVILAPGPDILFVLGKGIYQGRRTAIIAASGFAAGLSVHTTFAMLGISALLLASTVAFTILKIAGALYLVFLGIKAWTSRGLISLPAPGKAIVHRRIFGQAFLMNVLNPKVAIFFLAFLPQFVRPDAGSVPAQFFVLGVCFAIMALAVFSLVGFWSAALGAWLGTRPRFARVLDRIAGSVFLALGVRLAFARK